ncbi:MAG: molecular chaperone TorD family protein [Wolinella sp.]
MKHAEITQARALYYGLLGLFLTYKRLDSQRAEAIAGLDNIASFPIIDDIINDARTLSGELSSNGTSAIMQEFDDIFINGVNAKVVNLTASFYYEGQERGEKFLIVKEIVEQTPKRKDEAFVETEEHLGFLCAF